MAAGNPGTETGLEGIFGVVTAGELGGITEDPAPGALRPGTASGSGVAAGAPTFVSGAVEGGGGGGGGAIWPPSSCGGCGPVSGAG